MMAIYQRPATALVRLSDCCCLWATGASAKCRGLWMATSDWLHCTAQTRRTCQPPDSLGVLAVQSHRLVLPSAGSYVSSFLSLPIDLCVATRRPVWVYLLSVVRARFTDSIRRWHVRAPIDRVALDSFPTIASPSSADRSTLL